MPKESLRRRVANHFWGYDYFISYHWASGGAYAVALAQRLRNRGYDVFLDRGEFVAGDDWKSVGGRALRNTRRLVVVATREAVPESQSVDHELQVFAARSRQVVPIVFTGDATWPARHSIDGHDREKFAALRLIAASQLYIEDEFGNLTVGASETVVQRLVGTHRVMRRRDVRALVVGVVAAVLIAFSTVSTLFGVRAYLAQFSAEDARDAEKRARGLEAQERHLADERARIATSRQLAAMAALERTKRLDRSLLLAAEAFQRADTFEARDALFKALHERPNLTCFLQAAQDDVWATAFSPNGEMLAVGYGVDGAGAVALWDVRARRRLPFRPPGSRFSFVQGVAFSPDGKTLAGACGRIQTKSDFGGLIIWDVASQRRVTKPVIDLRSGLARGVAFAPHGKTIAVSAGRSVVFVDTATCQRLDDHVLPNSENKMAACDIAFSSDGKTLAVGYDRAGPEGEGVAYLDAVYRRWVDEETIPIDGAGVWSLAFHPDGKTIATGYSATGGARDDGGVMLWDVTGRARRAEGPVDFGKGAVLSLAFAPDGSTLAVGRRLENRNTGELILYDVANGDGPSNPRLPVSEGVVKRVAFLGAKQILDVWSKDRTGGLAANFTRYNHTGVAVWHVASHQRLFDGELSAPTDGDTCIAFSPDSKTLALGFSSAMGPTSGIAMLDVDFVPGPRAQFALPTAALPEANGASTFPTSHTAPASPTFPTAPASFRLALDSGHQWVAKSSGQFLHGNAEILPT